MPRRTGLTDELLGSEPKGGQCDNYCWDSQRASYANCLLGGGRKHSVGGVSVGPVLNAFKTASNIFRNLNKLVGTYLRTVKKLDGTYLRIEKQLNGTYFKLVGTYLRTVTTLVGTYLRTETQKTERNIF